MTAVAPGATPGQASGRGAAPSQKPGRVVTPEQVRARVAPILEGLRAGVAEREAKRILPRDDARLLTAAGLTSLRLPRAEGGAGASLRELSEAIIDLASADSGLAQALRSTFLTAESALASPPGPERNETVRRLVRGDIFAGTRNELGVKPGGVATRLRREGERYRLDGRKFYSTGGLYAQWLGGTALDEENRLVSFQVPSDREGIRLEDDFHAVGQNLSASGSMVFEDVVVKAAEVSHDTGPRLHPRTTFAQLYLAATLAGIARAVLDDGIRFVRRNARPVKHSSAADSSAADDPYIRERVGLIAAEAQAARSTVLFAAEELERAWSGHSSRDGEGQGGDEDGEAAASEAAVVVAQAQIAASQRALSAGEQLFDLGGGTAVRAEFALDRHWRNARTLSNHNSRDWKAAIAGRYHLTGESPPANGLF